jgi:CheY-like chemotaxis protein
VESQYGEGSTFSVRLRQKFVTDEPIGKASAGNLEAHGYAEGRRPSFPHLVRTRLPYARVLVVDDVQTNLDVAKGMMKPYGMRVDGVTSGPDAIRLIRAGEPRYSAIFMDHMMPDMDGIEAARVIREEIGTEYARTVPIIALTANALAGNEEMFLQRGFQAFLSKPIDVMLLDAVIRQWVRDKKLEAEYERAQAKDQRETQQADQQADQQEAQTPAQDQAEERAPRSGGELRQKGEEHAYDADTAEQGTAPLRVEGINMRKALSFLGDDEESLVMVLYAYLDSIPPVLDQIREIGEGGLPAYAIAVHGIKGSSRSICAEALGAQAEALEYAAKAGDMTFVRENNGPFIQAAEKLIAALRAALPEDNGLNL